MKINILIIVFLFSVQSIFAQDWSRFEKIESVSNSNPKVLAEKITAPYDIDEDKLAAIYYWLTHNMRYDVQKSEKVIKGQLDGFSASEEELAKKIEKETLSALKRKKGVCQDYSYVFQMLARHAGFECEYISGLAKSNYFRVNQLGVRHAWNAVKLNGKWVLLDATWGAGYVDENRKFNFKFFPGYFLCDPEAFTANHFPKEEKWQLTATPMTKEEYKKKPILGASFFSYGIKNLSPNQGEVILEKKQKHQITFTAEKDITQLVCYNLLRGKKQEISVVKKEGTYIVSLAVEKSGFYMFRQGDDIFFTQRIKLQ